MSQPARSGISWSAFLGVSWTWCIGMYLPVLLVRDFGVAGFLVFAIPNVVGAAAMGRMLPDAQSSRQFVARHRAACAAFSAVTILFHFFFVAWIGRGLIGPAAFGIFAAALAVFLVVSFNQRLTMRSAWVVLGGSLIAFGFVCSRGSWVIDGIHFLGKAKSLNLLGLAPVCVVGFALNPYLDLTFHRVRQATEPRAGVLAFVIGFYGCFASMILFTLCYARLLDPSAGALLPHPLAWAIALHMIVQSAFTVAMHLRSVATQRSPANRLGVLVGTVAEVCVLIFCIFSASGASPERTYRMLMGFYGLVFPAYLWICLNGATRRAMIVCAIAIAAAGPLFWLGFVDGEMLWLIPGIAIILLARLLTPAAPAPDAGTADPSLSRHVETTRAP